MRRRTITTGQGKPTMAQREVRFSAVYADEITMSRTVRVLVPVTTDENELREALWPHTGFERDGDIDSIYTADSVDGVYPTICMEWA